VDGYLIGIDAGTSVVKAVVFDLDGNELSRAGRNVPIQNPRSHMAEENMDQVWQAATEVLQEILKGSGVDPASILALSVTAQGDGSWMIGADGNPVGPAILWTDGRAGDIIDRWYADGTVSRQFDITGCGPYAGSTSPVLRWRIENQPELLGSGAKNLWCKDWVEYKLTGDISTDASDPSLMGIDVRTRHWSHEAMETLGIAQAEEWLPPIKAPTDLCGEVSRAAAQATGLRPGTPVFKGQFDVTASSLGVGVVSPGDAMAVVGTAGIVTVATDDVEAGFTPKDVGWLIPHTNRTWIRGLGMSCCTPNLDWFLREFGDPIRTESEARGDKVMWNLIDEKLQQVPVGSEGIIFHGYLAPGGERAPFVKPSARGSFNGITGSHNRDHMLRSVYEGIAYGIRDCIDSVPTDIRQVSIAGGGAASPIWSQIFADVLGRRIVVAAGTEYGAKGAAIVAGVGSGAYSSYEEGVAATVNVAREHEPNQANHELYNEFFAVYRKQREATQANWDDLQRAVRKVHDAVHA
jgi:sugar (pentulose or hexulose) kinase